MRYTPFRKRVDAPGRGPGNLRVLHVVGALNHGGTEILLLNVLKRLDRAKYQCDILVRDPAPGQLDEEARKIGARILRCAHHDGAFAYARKLFAILHAYGPYEVVHSHVYLFDGLVLAVAALAGVPVRISHSHTTQDTRKGTPSRLLQRAALRTAIKISATHLVAVSEASHQALFGARCAHTESSQIIPNGIEIPEHPVEYSRTEIRKELGIPETARVVGHVGRFDEGKNHEFLMACFQELSKRDGSWRIVLVGDGPLRQAVLKRASLLGLRESILDLGVRTDVNRLFHAMDIFVFPSLYEGFGLALLEAQAHGLPCFASSAVPREADAGAGLVTFMDLDDGPAEWAAAIARLRPRVPPYGMRRTAIINAGYDVRDRIPQWLGLYKASFEALEI